MRAIVSTFRKVSTETDQAHMLMKLAEIPLRT